MKMEALYLKAKGRPHGLIADYVGVCENTLRASLRDYQAGGVERLKQVNFHRPTSDLDDHRTALEAYFADHPSATIAEAADVIERLTGITRQSTQIRVFLRKLGLKRRETAAIRRPHEDPLKTPRKAQKTAMDKGRRIHKEHRPLPRHRLGEPRL